MRPILGNRAAAVIVAVVTACIASGVVAFELELPSDYFDWVEVEGENFTVVSNAEPKTSRRAAQSLEQLWRVMARDLDGVPAAAAAPNRVYLFDFLSDAYLPYGPLSKKGKPVKSGGFVAPRASATYIAIVEGDYRYPDSIDIQHKLAHAVIDAYHPGLPLWLSEGLAEYYSVFHVEDGEARLGYRIDRHVAWMRNKKMLPLDELFAVDTSSPDYSEDKRTGVFYAQSWLLTHMLMTERPDGRAEIDAYARLLRDGADHRSALSSAFGITVEELEAELRSYVRSRSYHYTVFPVSKSIVVGTKVSGMARAEVLAGLGDLLAEGRSERLEFAARHYQAALDFDDDLGPAVAGLGVVEDMRGRHESALEHYERAVQLAPESYRALVLFGRSLARAAEAETDAGDGTAPIERARAALRRAAELHPEWVEAWAELGRTYLIDDGDVEAGIDALERAMRLQPKRAGVGVDLATMYARQGSAQEVESVLARMQAAGVAEDELVRATALVGSPTSTPEGGTKPMASTR